MGNDNGKQIYKRDAALGELISNYEDSIKAEERITKWYGDYGVNEIKYTVSDELVKEKADKALEILGMSYNDYMKNYKESSTNMEIRLKEIFSAHQEATKVTKQEFIENLEPTEPVITIEYSENEQLKDGVEMPLSMADEIFNDLSMQDNVPGIEEVIYTIKYVLDGKENTYEGSIYTGDKIGGVVDHISHFGRFFRNNAAFQDYLKRKKTPEEIEKLNAGCEYNTYKLTPYLQSHINLLKIKQIAKEELDVLKKLDLSNAENYKKFEYNNALQKYVNDFRQILNYGDWKELPEMPKLEDFEKENIEYTKVAEVLYDESKPEVTKVPTNGEKVEEKKSGGYTETLRKTKEQYTSQKKEQLNQINAEIHEIVDGFQQNPETIAELLEFGTKFYKYSVRNQLLIMNQNKGATYLKSFADWKKEGYCVKRGEKGLKILAPVKVTYLKLSEDNYIKLSEASKEMQQLYKLGKIASIQKTYYTVGNVFDISQTTCPVEKYPEYYGMGYQNHDQNKMIVGIIAYSERKLGVPVEVKDFSSISLRGYYYPDAKKIKLNALLKTTEKMSTLVHEIGHAVMEHSSDIGLSIYQKEFEADCFSIMLNKHLGIELTERRRSHLSESYNNMKNDYIKSNIDFEFDKIVGNVFKRFNNVVEDIDKYIDEQLNKEMDISQNLEQEKVTSIFNDCQNPSIYEKMIESYNTELLDNRYEMEMA